MSTSLRNKRAYFDYEILDEIEAGVALLGAEVKAVRCGRGSLVGAFVSLRSGIATLKGWQIPRWEFSRDAIDERRDRTLLLHKNQIKRWEKKLSAGGLTIVPLKLYFNKRGRAKLLIGLARGKKQHDKRATLKKRDSDRKLGAAMRRR